jgi:hypothetical protein
LFGGDLVNWSGEYYQVDSARLWDLPETPVAIGAAVSGEKSVHLFAPLADHLIAVQPNKELVDAWHDSREATGLPERSRATGQIPISWDSDRDAAVQRAHEQFRWFGGGWRRDETPDGGEWRIRTGRAAPRCRKVSPIRGAQPADVANPRLTHICAGHSQFACFERPRTTTSKGEHDDRIPGPVRHHRHRYRRVRAAT